jgi:hypothetical protein
VALIVGFSGRGGAATSPPLPFSFARYFRQSTFSSGPVAEISLIVTHPTRDDRKIRSFELTSAAHGGFDRIMFEPYALKFLAEKPDADDTRDFAVVENIGVHRIHGHDRTAGFQRHEISRFENSH